jgi:phage terminase Nu1 subunit (DNA packaging protein)
MIVSVTEFAEIIGRSQGRVSQLISEGLPTISRGGGGNGPAEIDTAEAIAWLLAKAADSSGVAAERTKLLKVQRERAEIELKARIGALADLAAVRRIAREEAQALAGLIQHSYGQLPPVLAGADQQTMAGLIQQWFEPRLLRHADEIDRRFQALSERHHA